jgi:hypothetical protein
MHPAWTCGIDIFRLDEHGQGHRALGRPAGHQGPCRQRLRHLPACTLFAASAPGRGCLSGRPPRAGLSPHPPLHDLFKPRRHPVSRATTTTSENDLAVEASRAVESGEDFGVSHPCLGPWSTNGRRHRLAQDTHRPRSPRYVRDRQRCRISRHARPCRVLRRCLSRLGKGV